MATLQQIQAAMTGFPRNLLWRDFRPVQTSPNPPRAAQTGSSWSMGGWTVALVNGAYRVQGVRVTVSLDSNTTWAIPSARTNAPLLQHEQGHYDITGLIARDLTRKVLDLSLDAAVVAALKGSGNSPAQHRQYVQQQFQASINAFGAQATAIMNRLQTNPVTGQDGIYDTQTNHSLNAAAQATWDNRFQQMKSRDDNFELWLTMAGVI